MTHTESKSFLETILRRKREEEVPERKRRIGIAQIRSMAEAAPAITHDFETALRRSDSRVALIAEIKRASPSKGDLVTGEFRPLDLAQTYQANGASAISVLTDERFFKGSLDTLTQVKHSVNIPVLRKDFIIDPYQIYEARAAGADAVLLIVAALDNDSLKDYYVLARELALTPLVEVHDEHETDRALQIGARVIGVNNRDLRTFVTDIHTTMKCARMTGPDCVLVSESGIYTVDDVKRVAAMGAQAVLVGESIITSSDRAAQVRALSGVALNDDML
ncbi:MAG: indole-3-glycerol phosphate synthase TrpC [Chloroflexi bacterium]|nr:indole-3-glycerol phosphate synthase TrpC [Chloroflexota bacterium]MCL5273757.1 indole-3-glycerol phosphate synthase TrpC [Chloroflexota bacterium]